jgi:hypothetical protein
VAVFDRFPIPGMSAHIDTNRTVVSTDSTLYTASRVWYDLARSEDLVSARLPLEQSKKTHDFTVVLCGKVIGFESIIWIYEMIKVIRMS